jgi:shikimate kinase
VKRVLITGMSGTGKSTVIRELRRLGYKTVDTDWDPKWEHPPAEAGDGPGWLWREDRIGELLETEDAETLFVSACVENQSKFYPRFDHVVLLTASPELTRERLARRTTNPYGRWPHEVAEVLRFKASVEPLLRRAATVEIDSAAPLAEVVGRLVSLVR